MTTKIDITKESVWVNGILLDLDISWWKGFIQLVPNDIDKMNSEIPDIFKLGRKRMLENDVFTPFQRVESQARVDLTKNSYHFIVDKVRFIPYSTLDEVINNFVILKEEFDLNRDLFVASYQQNKAAFLGKYPDVAEKLIGSYPTINELYAKFDFSWKMLEMNLPRDVSTVMIDESRKGMLVQEYEKMKDGLNGQLDSWVIQVSRQMRKTIITTCENMQKTLSEGNIIRTSTLSNARETIERVKSMNFIGDEEVDRILSDFERNLPQLNDRDAPEVMTAFNETMDKVVASLSVDDISSTGQIKRSFKFD